MIVAVLLLGFSDSERVQIWWGIPVLIYFAIVIVMDVEFKIVMHPISIAGAMMGLVVGTYLRGAVVTLVGGAVGFVVMYLLFKLGNYLCGSSIGEEGKERQWMRLPLGLAM